MEEVVKVGWLVGFFKGGQESTEHGASLHFPFLIQG